MLCGIDAVKGEGQNTLKKMSCKFSVCHLSTKKFLVSSELFFQVKGALDIKFL